MGSPRRRPSGPSARRSRVPGSTSFSGLVGWEQHSDPLPLVPPALTVHRSAALLAPTQRRPTVDQRTALLNAHVQFELARWRADAIAATVEEECAALLAWLDTVPLADLVSQEQVTGWVTRVCFSSSAVPVNMMDVMSKPSNTLALSNRSRARELASYKSLPIPGNCEPCPGKMYAFTR